MTWSRCRSARPGASDSSSCRRTSRACAAKASGFWSGVLNTHFWIDRASGVAGAVLTQLIPMFDEALLEVVAGFEMGGLRRDLTYAATTSRAAIARSRAGWRSSAFGQS